MRTKIDKADSLFSKYIKLRDNWTCTRCGTKYQEGDRGIHNSHYWGRGNEGTRFEPDNCTSLCYGCHRLWGHGDEKDLYKEWMIKKLGTRRFKSLEVQARTYCKKDRKLAYLAIKELMKV